MLGSTRPRICTASRNASRSTASLSDDAFAAETRAAAAAAAAPGSSEPDVGQVTTFELLTAMAFNTFARHGCQLAVIEVGLGGRYDSTNVIDPIVSVITRIDLEHTAVLGPTHADIAWQRRGSCGRRPRLEPAGSGRAQDDCPSRR